MGNQEGDDYQGRRGKRERLSRTRGTDCLADLACSRHGRAAIRLPSRCSKLTMEPRNTPALRFPHESSSPRWSNTEAARSAIGKRTPQRGGIGLELKAASTTSASAQPGTMPERSSWISTRVVGAGQDEAVNRDVAQPGGARSDSASPLIGVSAGVSSPRHLATDCNRSERSEPQSITSPTAGSHRVGWSNWAASA